MERAKQLMEMVAKYESLIYDTADYIWKNPETGYREWKTSAYMEEHFEALGYTLTKAGNIPGFYTDLDTGRPGPKIAILGELDSLIVGNHPDADPETHAVHACGHNAQCAILLGVAAAMKEPGALDGLCGSIRFMAVPAEELIELGFREELRKQGVIRYFGGKVEFISRGYFDGVDMAMMIHSGKLPEGKTLSVSQGCNGCITKNITFKGVASHAGGSPHLGRSALDALELMNMGVQFLREHIIPEARIHYAITNTGGDAPNVVQAEAESVYLIRAPKNDQVREIYERVNQIARGAAMMCGVEVEIQLEKACSNILVNHTLEEVLYENMKAVGLPEYTEEEYAFASAIQDTMPGRQKLADRFERIMGEKGRVLGEQYDKKSIYSFILPYRPSEKPLSGSSDVGDVSWVCPTSQIVAATCAGGTPEHTWQMVSQGKSSIAHKGLLYAGKVLAAAAIDLLDDPELVKKAAEEFQRKTGPDGYQPLLPKDAKPWMKK